MLYVLAKLSSWSFTGIVREASINTGQCVWWFTKFLFKWGFGRSGYHVIIMCFLISYLHSHALIFCGTGSMLLILWITCIFSFGPKYTISQSICCLSHLCRFRFSLCYLSVVMVYLALIRHFFLIYILELFSCVHLDCSSTCSCSNPWRTSRCCYNVSTQTFTIEQMTRSYCVTVCTSLSILWKGTLLED